MLKRCSMWVLIAGAIGYVAGNFGAGVVTWYMPKLYESEAVIRVVPTKLMPVYDGESAVVSKDRFLKEQISNILCPETIDLGFKCFEIKRPKYNSYGTTPASIRNGLKCQILEQTGDISVKLRLRSKFAARDVLVGLIEAYSVRITEVPSENKEEYGKAKKRQKEIRHRISEIQDDLKLPLDTQYFDDEYFERELNHALKTQSVLVASQLMECKKLWKQHVDLELKLIELRNAPQIDCIKEPAVSDRPSSPNVSLNLSVGRISGVFFLRSLP